jgi:hypothetical protein
MLYKIVRHYASPYYAPTTQAVALTLTTVKAHCDGAGGSSDSSAPDDVAHTRKYGEWHDTYEPFLPRPREDYHADILP